MEIKTKVEDTIFSDYDTIVFDMDGTILDCFTKRGDSIGVYQTVPPYKLRTSTMLVDIEGNIVRLEPGVRDLFQWLDENDVNIGVVSAGEKDDTTFEGQPGILVLRKFDLKKFINYEIVFKHDMNKADYVKPLGKTLFIDNKDENLDDVDKKGQVDVLNRGSFENWQDLLEKKSSILNLHLFQLVSYGNKDIANTVASFYKDMLDYSKIKLKMNKAKFVTPKELERLSNLRLDLPPMMEKLASVIPGQRGNTNFSILSSRIWNEDYWPQAFQILDDAIDLIGI